MKKILLTTLSLISIAHAQVTKYVISSCVIQQMDGKRDTVFDASDGNINCTLNMTTKTISFDWKTKSYKSVKLYKVVEQQVIKEKIYETMGVYSMALKCLNKDGKKCTINFGINSRINYIDIVVADGEFILNYKAVQTQ